MRRIEAERIAVLVGLDLVGDALWKLPFLRALRNGYPGARISWITTKGPTAYARELRDLTRGLWSEVIENAPIPQSWPDLWQPLTFSERFDLILDTRGRAREAIVGRRLPHRYYLAPAARWLFSDRAPALRDRRMPHILDRLLQMVTLATAAPPDVGGDLPIEAGLRETAAHVLPHSHRYLGLAVGAGNPIKIWPLERFMAIANRAREEGFVPAFLLGPNETELMEKIAAAVPFAQFPLTDARFTGPLSVARTVAVAERLALAIANDSGTGHMIAAAGCPLLSLFGPTSAAKLAPRGQGSCLALTPPSGLTAMEDITVEAVELVLHPLKKRAAINP